MHPEHYLAKQISNKNLYHRCDFIPLTDRIELSRWTMLGHVLRLPKTSPAALAFVYALDGCHVEVDTRFIFGERCCQEEVNEIISSLSVY